MYRISHERCVCFLFLVISVVLSCTGFRIDDLAMTDSSERTLRPTTDSSPFQAPHRIRHQRLFRARHHPRPHVEAIISPPTTYQPSELLAQVPSTDLQDAPNPTRPLVSRPQRSPARGAHRRQRDKWSVEQEDDISLSTYEAQIVLLATIQSWNMNTNVFKVQKTFKRVSWFNRKTIVLNLDNLVRERKYILFLNASSSSNYFPVGKPKLVRPKKEKRIKDLIRKVVRTNVTKIAKVELNEMKKKEDKRILLCKVKGFPVPRILWRRNGEVVHQRGGLVIRYKKRESRLIIRRLNANLEGSYDCVAQVGNVTKASTAKTIKVSTPSESNSSGKECSEKMKSDYCMNGGTCQLDSMEEVYCICPTGFIGVKCTEKLPSDTSNIHYNKTTYNYSQYPRCYDDDSTGVYRQGTMPGPSVTMSMGYNYKKVHT